MLLWCVENDHAAILIMTQRIMSQEDIQKAVWIRGLHILGQMFIIPGLACSARQWILLDIDVIMINICISISI